MISLDGEPTLEELLAEPIVRALMARDGISPEAIRAALRGLDLALFPARQPKGVKPTALTRSCPYRETVEGG